MPGNTLTIVSTTSNAPDTIITSAIDGNGAPVSNGGSTLSTTIQIAFKGIGNNIVGFQCSLDGSTFSSCTSPFTASKLQAGTEHTFKVRAVNSLGVKDATPAVFSWFVLTPAQAINDLIRLVKSMNLGEPTNSVLVSLLEAAAQFVSHSPTNNAAACGELVAFTAQVQGAVGLNKLTPAQAFQLLESAQAIEKTLDC